MADDSKHLPRRQTASKPILKYSYRKLEEKPRRLGQFGIRLLGEKCEHLLQNESQPNVSNSASLYRGKPSSVPSSLGFTAPGSSRSAAAHGTCTTKASSFSTTERSKSANPELIVSSAISPTPTEGERVMGSNCKILKSAKSDVQKQAQSLKSTKGDAQKQVQSPKTAKNDVHIQSQKNVRTTMDMPSNASLNARSTVESESSQENGNVLFTSSAGHLPVNDYHAPARVTSGGFTRPVPLFKHSDIRHLHQQDIGYTNGTANINAFSGSGAANNSYSKPCPTFSTGSYGAFSSLQKSAGTSSFLQPTSSAPSSGQNQHQYTIINNSVTSGVVTTTPSNRTKSPYARPLSAKEVEPPHEEISMEMLHSILQAASAHDFHGHHKMRYKQNTNETPSNAFVTSGTSSGIQTNAFLRPNSAYREKYVPNTKPDHRKDPRITAQNHLERTVSKPNVVTSDSNKNTQDGAMTSSSIKKSSVPVANGYSISSNVARFGHDRDMLYTEGASIKPRPIINDIDDPSQRKSSAQMRPTAIAKGQPYIQVATNPRPLPQPPTSAKAQGNRPTTSDVAKTNTYNTAAISKPATPSTSNSSIKADGQNYQKAQGLNKDLVNSGLGRVIASPAVQRQLFADQTFSNKDGYKRTVVAVNNSSMERKDADTKQQSNTEGSGNSNGITTGIAYSNKVNTSRPTTPKSSIPRPGTGKQHNQSSIQNTDNTQAQKASVTKPTKHITPFSKGSIKTGRSLTSSHLSIKPPTGPYKDSILKVRNLNYTPNKPYSEVSEPGSPTSDRASCSGANSSCSSPQPEQNSGLTANDFASSTLGGSSSTLFYRKLSKAEEIIHDLSKRPRPKTEGAPTKVARADEKMEVSQLISSSSKMTTVTAESDDGEWEDEQDDEDDSERVPGDGEDDSDDYDDEDDVIDNLDDDYESGSDDDESDKLSSVSRSGFRIKSATKRMLGLSIKDSRSRRSLSRSRPVSAVSSVSTAGDLQPALTQSLFKHVPPTLNFVIDGEKVEQLPWEIRKLLKWKMSPITPNVVKNCISRSYFRPSKKNHDWLGYWGKHMKAQGFKAIREYQKVNHLPGSFQIGRKDRLWRNLSRMQVHFGKREYNFFPQTFCLPYDLKQLKRTWEDGGNKQKWIIKPPASARGIGIKVISKWNQIPKRKPVIVQRYLSRPYLINESKFDLRIYVYVTCFDPLRIYVYDDGLVRFASTKYSHAMKNLSNKYMHLTNYSINKRNNEYQSNTDETQCQGHKWGLKALWGYLKKRGVDTSRVWENIHDLIVKTVISSESCVNSLVKINVRRRYCVHELFGFDVMLDENLKPWIIEVNISPSLHSNSQLDINIKGGMIKDLLNLAGFMIPHKNDVTATPYSPPEPGRYNVPKEICINSKLYPTQMSPDERAKHAYYCQRHTDENVQATILETITPDDLRILVESLDEESRRGNFIRVFPSPMSHKYLKFFESARYYNLLLDTWVQRFHRVEPNGIAMLEPMCERKIHLENPTYDPRHQWAPPNANLLREPRIVSAPGVQYRNSSAALPRLKKNKKHSGSTSSLNYADSTTSSRTSSRTVVGSDAS